MAVHISVSFFKYICDGSHSRIIVFLLLPYDTKSFLVVFLALNCRINFSWNPGLYLLMWRNWILLLQLWLVIRLWIIHLAVFCYHITCRRNGWIVFIYCCSRTKGIMEYCSCWVLGFQYEFYFDDTIFLFHTHYRKKCFMRFYHGDTVGVYYKVQVDSMIFGHDNHWWQWVLPDNSNSVMDYFH